MSIDLRLSPLLPDAQPFKIGQEVLDCSGSVGSAAGSHVTGEKLSEVPGGLAGSLTILRPVRNGRPVRSIRVPGERHPRCAHGSGWEALPRWTEFSRTTGMTCATIFADDDPMRLVTRKGTRWVPPETTLALLRLSSNATIGGWEVSQSERGTFTQLSRVRALSRIQMSAGLSRRTRVGP